MVHEEAHVRLALPLAHEELREALDRHVGDREETVELDPEAAAELVLVARLELRLWRREKGADRVVDEVQDER